MSDASPGVPNLSLLQADAPAPAEPSAGRPYGLLGLVVGSALILVGALLVFAILAGAALVAYTGAVGWQTIADRTAYLDSSEQAKLGILGSLLAYAALSLSVLVAARIRGGQHWRDVVAWLPWSPLRGAAWVWGLAALLILYSAVADTTIEHFHPGFNPLTKMPGEGRWRVLFVILAAVAAPITEELIFRGWLYTSLRAAIGIAASMLLVSVLFAIAHWESTHLYALAVFPVGLALAFVRERTGSIKASMLVHGVYNGIASMLLFFAK